MKDFSLFIETSFGGVGLAWMGDSKLEYFLYPHSGNSLFLLADKVLSLEKAYDQKISKIGISHGPGSFTGIKIGLSFLYGLKAGRPELKILNYSGLEAAWLQHKDPCLALYLPSTKAHGYVVYEENQKREIKSIDQHSFSLKPLTFLDSEKDTQGSLEYAYHHYDSFVGGDVIPKPHYMREPTIASRVNPYMKDQ